MASHIARDLQALDLIRVVKESQYENAVEVERLQEQGNLLKEQGRALEEARRLKQIEMDVNDKLVKDGMERALKLEEEVQELMYSLYSPQPLQSRTQSPLAGMVDVKITVATKNEINPKVEVSSIAVPPQPQQILSPSPNLSKVAKVPSAASSMAGGSPVQLQQASKNSVPSQQNIIIPQLEVKAQPPIPQVVAVTAKNNSAPPLAPSAAPGMDTSLAAKEKKNDPRPSEEDTEAVEEAIIQLGSSLSLMAQSSIRSEEKIEMKLQECISQCRAVSSFPKRNLEQNEKNHLPKYLEMTRQLIFPYLDCLAYVLFATITEPGKGQNVVRLKRLLEDQMMAMNDGQTYLSILTFAKILASLKAGLKEGLDKMRLITENNVSQQPRQQSPFATSQQSIPQQTTSKAPLLSVSQTYEAQMNREKLEAEKKRIAMELEAHQLKQMRQQIMIQEKTLLEQQEKAERLITSSFESQYDTHAMIMPTKGGYGPGGDFYYNIQTRASSGMNQGPGIKSDIPVTNNSQGSPLMHNMQAVPVIHTSGNATIASPSVNPNTKKRPAPTSTAGEVATPPPTSRRRNGSTTNNSAPNEPVPPPPPPPSRRPTSNPIKIGKRASPAVVPALPLDGSQPSVSGGGGGGDVTIPTPTLGTSSPTAVAAEGVNSASQNVPLSVAAGEDRGVASVEGVSVHQKYKNFEEASEGKKKQEEGQGTPASNNVKPLS